MVTQLFNTYIPKSELDLTKSNTSMLEIKCNELDALVKAHRKLVDNNSNALGFFEKGSQWVPAEVGNQGRGAGHFKRFGFIISSRPP